VERRIQNRARILVRGSLFGESRLNGTPLQTNRTHSWELSGGAELQTPSNSLLSLRGYIARQVYDQNFTAVTSDRSAETLTRLQRVPAQIVGFSGQWSRNFANGKHTFVAGAEARTTRGTSDEVGFFQNGASILASSGGRELTTGAFVEDIYRLHARVILTGSLRFDRWLNYRGSSVIQSVSTNATASIHYGDRSETAVSPQLSGLFRANSLLSFQVSTYRAFRQPTLNELYRSFRVGDVLTLANENLRAERLLGVEAGATLRPRESVRIRGSFFEARINNPIANATLSVTPLLITRQRRNLGTTRTRGFELETELSINKGLSLSASYLFADARVLRFPGNAVLEGLLIPQIPRHQLTAQLWYSNRNFLSFGIQARTSSSQYEDDLNRLKLNSYFQLDARISRNLSRTVELFVAAENLLNTRYAIGRTPVLTVAAPALIRVGLEFRLPVAK
jgi:outer membrane receptor protein involved in Fe transport